MPDQPDPPAAGQPPEYEDARRLVFEGHPPILAGRRARTGSAARGPLGDQFVLGRVDVAGGPPEPDRGPRPQRRVAPGGIEVPAHAAAGGPDRGRHPPLDVVAPAPLRAGRVSMAAAPVRSRVP